MSTPATSSQARAIAERLDQAFRTKTPIAPVTETDGVNDTATAYAIQTELTKIRLARGEKIAGRKIGLTSVAVQQQLGVDQPDYGTLWQSNYYESKGGKVTIPAADFIQPKIEGEVAFLMGKSLREPGVTPEQILAATDACAIGVEVADSRIANWKIKFCDTVSDNASFGGFTTGAWDKKLKDSDLSALTMSITHNGAPAGEGPTSAVLGNPAISAAWLANKLLEFGVSLEPGDVIISGAVLKMLPMVAGDQFVFSLTGQPDLNITIA